jgi:hypothetical protein
MKITRTSILSGKTTTKEINITEQQLEQWRRGKHLQWLCPQLSVDDREFLISGATPEEWSEIFLGDEE